MNPRPSFRQTAVVILCYYGVTGLISTVHGVFLGGMNPLWILACLFLWPLLAPMELHLWWPIPVLGIVVTSGLLSITDLSNVPEWTKRVSGENLATVFGVLGVAELLSRAISPAFFALYVVMYPEDYGIGMSDLPELYVSSFEVLAQRWYMLHFYGWSLSVPNLWKTLTDPSGHLTQAGIQINRTSYLFGGIGFSTLLGYSASMVVAYVLIRWVRARITGYRQHDSEHDGELQ